MDIMSLWWYHLVSQMHQQHLCALWIVSSAGIWTNSFLFSLMTFLFILKMKKSMKNIWDQHCNCSENINCMQNLASVTSIKIEFTTWVTLFQKRVYPWTLTILKLLRISLTPKNVTEVRYFMGLVGYYKRFIEGFSKVAHAITSLQRKGIKFKWTSKS